MVRNSVAVLLDDHDLVAMTMPVPAMPAAMRPVLGTRPVMVLMMTHVVSTTLDHDGLRARNRRRGQNERTKRGQSDSQLLHYLLSFLGMSGHSTA